MNFQNFEYFLITEEERSFTKAADRLHITQQTLSANISNLEKELGSRLFIRHVPLELTYAGQVFREYAIGFRAKYMSMQKEFEDIRGGNNGLLKIGIGYTRGRTIMPALTALFQKEYPHYNVELVEGSNDMLASQLLDGVIDLAIGNFSRKEPGIQLFPFYEEEIILLVTRQLLEECYADRCSFVIDELKAKNLSSLNGCPFVLGRPEDVTGKLSRKFLLDNNLSPEIRALSDNVETLLAMCLRSIGACFCPRNLMEMTLSPGQQDKLLVFSLPEEARYQIRFGVRSQNYQWSAIMEFMRIASESGLFTEN